MHAFAWYLSWGARRPRCQPRHYPFRDILAVAWRKQYNQIPDSFVAVQLGCDLLAGRNGLHYLYPNCAAEQSVSIRAVVPKR
jgi:hypothetical protein